jgi:ornithine cyclodeaminase/alanine dehydrogenase-like protein (mu-crystallin family)
MLIIDNDTVKSLLSMADCIRVQEEAFAATLSGEAVCRPRIDTFSPCARADGYYRFGSTEGASHGVHAVRLKSDIMTWPKSADGTWSESKHCISPGTYCGLVMLFSTADGAPLAIINDGYLQHLRVGGSAGIGAKLMSRPESRIIGMIGSGGMARTALEALAVVRKIEKVKVHSRNAANARAYAEEMSELLGVEIEPVGTAREAVRGVDILTTATDSMLPVIEGAWLEPGMHVVNIGPHDLGPDSVARIDRVVRQGEEALDLSSLAGSAVGMGHSRSALVSGTPEQLKRIPKSEGKKSNAKLVKAWPIYTDVISGKAQGRAHPDEITQYSPVGNWGVQFSACGAYIYTRAVEAGLGRQLPTEWFLQSIKN